MTRIALALALASMGCASHELVLVAPPSDAGTEPLVPSQPLVTPPLRSLMTLPVSDARAACSATTCLVASDGRAFRYERPSGRPIDTVPWELRPPGVEQLVRAVAVRDEQFAVAFADGCFSFVVGRDVEEACITGFRTTDVTATNDGFVAVGQNTEGALAAWEWAPDGPVLRVETLPAFVSVLSAFALAGDPATVFWSEYAWGRAGGRRIYISHLDEGDGAEFFSAPYGDHDEVLDAARIGPTLFVAARAFSTGIGWGTDILKLDLVLTVSATFRIPGSDSSCGAHLMALGDGLLLSGCGRITRLDRGALGVHDQLELPCSGRDLVLPLSTTRLLVLDECEARVRERFVTYP